MTDDEDAKALFHAGLQLGKAHRALTEIKQWANAYPVKTFTPLTEAQMHAAAAALKEIGVDMGALHAGWARHILNGIAEICDQGLADD